MFVFSAALGKTIGMSENLPPFRVAIGEGDWRASAEYRAAAAANLLRRFFHEQEGQAPVRLAVA